MGSLKGAFEKTELPYQNSQHHYQDFLANEFKVLEVYHNKRIQKYKNNLPGLQLKPYQLRVK